jgi:hypothetical protein
MSRVKDFGAGNSPDLAGAGGKHGAYQGVEGVAKAAGGNVIGAGEVVPL